MILRKAWQDDLYSRAAIEGVRRWFAFPATAMRTPGMLSGGGEITYAAAGTNAVTAQAGIGCAC